MSLDLSKVVKQISEMVAQFTIHRRERNDRIDRALEILRNYADNLDSLKKKIALSKTTWLVADPVNSIDLHIPLSETPPDFTVIATDGSHIDVDRHHATRCYLINIGSVELQYGSHPDAFLDSEPVIYSSDDDLVIASPDGLREVPVEYQTQPGGMPSPIGDGCRASNRVCSVGADGWFPDSLES
jgi:hypothetical protein